jgi:hypothetical protein
MHKIKFIFFHIFLCGLVETKLYSSPSLAQQCNLSGSVIEYTAVICDKHRGGCDGGGDPLPGKLTILGGKVLSQSHKDLSNNEFGVIYTIGVATDILVDPAHLAFFDRIQRDNQTGMRFTRWIARADYKDDMLILKDDTAHTVMGSTGKTVSTVMIRIIDCTRCEVVRKGSTAWSDDQLVWASTLRKQTCHMSHR